MRYLLLIIFWGFLTGHAWASYQISCPSKNILAINQTINEPSYFNNLYNATDCTITQIADPAPLTAAAQTALLNAQLAHAQQAAQLNAQLEANRAAYVDALMSGNTASQQSIATAQAALKSQSAQ